LVRTPRILGRPYKARRYRPSLLGLPLAPPPSSRINPSPSAAAFGARSRRHRLAVSPPPLDVRASSELRVVVGTLGDPLPLSLVSPSRPNSSPELVSCALPRSPSSRSPKPRSDPAFAFLAVSPSSPKRKLVIEKP
jgi:hypothetical protein